MSLWLEGFDSHGQASRLNNIFDLYAHRDILDKPSLRESDEEVESRTIGKIKVSSAKVWHVKIFRVINHQYRLRIWHLRLIRLINH